MHFQSISRSLTSSGHVHVDLVQFAAPMFYLDEAEGHVFVDVMRLGRLEGSLKVRYFSEDSSAIAGVKYYAEAGQLSFQPGERVKSVKVSSIPDNFFSPALEFKMVLTDPEGCHLGHYLHTCRVKLIDDDPFPSQRYKEHLDRGKAGLKTINGPGLFAEFFKLMLRDYRVLRKLMAILCFDQLYNLYLYFTIWVQMYLVDVLLNVGDETTVSSLWVPGNRNETALLIGAAYICPMLLLHGWGLAKVHLDMDGNARCFLQECLFSKYLIYTESSRHEVRPSDMVVAMTEDALEVSEAFLGAMELLQLIGKLLVLTYFVWKQNPSALWCAFTMPVVMIGVAILRFSKLEKAAGLVGERQVEMIALTDETCARYRLIADYAKRPQMCDLLRKRVQAVRLALVREKTVRMNNENVPCWVGAVFIGVYIAMQTKTVLVGQVSAGTFLATIGILQSISVDFSDLFKLTMLFSSAIEPLKSITLLLNMPTELRIWKDVNRHGRERTRTLMDALINTPRNKGHFVALPDRLHIEMDNVCIRHSNGRYDSMVLRNISFSVPQGKMVAVLGDHGVGRSTFMKCLGRVFFPTSGTFFIPSHIRVLHVDQESVLLNLSLWENVTFGCLHPSHANPERINEILTGMSMVESLKILQGEIKTNAHDAKKASRAKRARRTLEKTLESQGGALATPGRQMQRAKVLIQKGVFRPALAVEHKPGGNADSEDEADESDDDDSSGSNDSDEEEDEITLDGAELNWQEQLTYTERAKLHLVRALVVNPEVLVLDRALYHYHDDMVDDILTVLRQFVADKGYCMPEHDHHHRRPRTLFFSPERETQAKTADVTWRLCKSGGNLSLIDQDADPSTLLSEPIVPHENKAAIPFSPIASPLPTSRNYSVSPRPPEAPRSNGHRDPRCHEIRSLARASGEVYIRSPMLRPYHLTR